MTNSQGAPAESTLAEFVAVHDDYVAAWEYAFRTRDASHVESFLGAAYHLYSGANAVEEPAFFDLTVAREGLRKTLEAMPGAGVRVENRVLRLRGTAEVLAFYEKIVEHEGRVLAAIVLEAWRKADKSWRLAREYIERGTTPSAPT